MSEANGGSKDQLDLQVASGLAFVISCTKRTRLIIHVLGGFSFSSRGNGKDEAHKDPSMNIPVSEIFCARVVCRFHTAGNGNTSSTKSVKTLGAEPMMKNSGALIQVPLMLLSQVYCTGRHWSAQTRITIIPQQTEKVPMM